MVMFLTTVSRGRCALSCCSITLRSVLDNIILVVTWFDQVSPRAGTSSLLSPLKAVVTCSKYKITQVQEGTYLNY